MFIIYIKEICKRFCVNVYFHSVGCIPKSGIARSYGTFMFNFLRHAFFSSRCTMVHSDQQCIRVPIFLHSPPHLSRSFKNY